VFYFLEKQQKERERERERAEERRGNRLTKLISYLACHIVKSNNGESDAETALLLVCRNDTTVSFIIRGSRVKLKALILIHPVRRMKGKLRVEN
jgi:hypothetical protein